MGFVPDLLNWTYIMQGVKNKSNTSFTIYIYMRNSATFGFGLKWGDD